METFDVRIIVYILTLLVPVSLALPLFLTDEGHFCLAHGFDGNSYEGTIYDDTHYVLCASSTKNATWFSKEEYQTWRRNPNHPQKSFEDVRKEAEAKARSI